MFHLDATAIAVSIAAIAAATVALGPLVRAAIEAIEATPLIPSGYAGVAAIFLGSVIGVLVGILTGAQTGSWWWILVGLLGGLGAGFGAIQTDHAVTGAAVKASGHAAPVVAIAAPAATTSANPATTASSVVFTPAAVDPKASSSGALDV